jgi:hypothetical protein
MHPVKVREYAVLISQHLLVPFTLAFQPDPYQYDQRPSERCESGKIGEEGIARIQADLTTNQVENNPSGESDNDDKHRLTALPPRAVILPFHRRMLPYSIATCGLIHAALIHLLGERCLLTCGQRLCLTDPIVTRHAALEPDKVLVGPCHIIH